MGYFGQETLVDRFCERSIVEQISIFDEDPIWTPRALGYAGDFLASSRYSVARLSSMPLSRPRSRS